MLRHAESAPEEEVGDTLKPPIALRRMFSESRMREIRPSGLMRGGSWLTHLGQLLPTLPPSARLLGGGVGARLSVPKRLGSYLKAILCPNFHFVLPRANSAGAVVVQLDHTGQFEKRNSSVSVAVGCVG